ncbi:unnamed protein product [Rhizoctonia solani]|uniref:Uncharacterized protein n=1 Tax=Rhizoctonia solani TaxID=456999 RepID=A0A8H3GVR1_9AGAM|nr:unnamed protein product [Rhizoctonia solani]
MSRPSKRKRTSRNNLLKARAKMNILRSLRREAETGLSQEVESANVGHPVYSTSTVTENNGQTRTAFSEPNVFEDSGNIPEKSKACVHEGGLNFNKLADQLVDGGAMHKGPLVGKLCSEGSESKIKIGACSILEGEAQKLMAESEGTETVRPTGNKVKSYLKMYKESFRAFKRTKLATQFPATSRDLWRAEGMLRIGGGRQTAMVGF